jgi:hypothetical protein
MSRPGVLVFVVSFVGVLVGWSGVAGGAVWSIQPSPNPPSSTGQLAAVSCASLVACVAVGSSLNSAMQPVPLAERWDGTSWWIQPTPNPFAQSGAQLSGVSCTSATACTAVGSGGGGSLVERWDGTNWTLEPTPTSQGQSLLGVSCTSATACTAVGSDGGGSLVERWDGTNWTVEPTPTSEGESLTGVSCTSDTACTAVGNLGVVVHWDGTSWSGQAAPKLPAGPVDIVTEGVSCTSDTACTAVGGYYGPYPSAETTFAERWDGTSWSIEPTPSPTTRFDSALSAVSCTSATDCTAVGTSSSFPSTTFAERWDGTSWSIESTPTRRVWRVASCRGCPARPRARARRSAAQRG